MNKIKQLRCKAIFDSNIEEINPLFSKVKIKIAYTGINRNNSYISKDAFEKALPTIYNCPIIGEFIETTDDFGSHGGKIEISDQGIKYIQTTKPYGVINENSEITWEDVIEEDGTINTYLCATGYLWTGRYDELETVIKNSKSQSMEIEISNGNFQDINGQKVFAIEDFIFSAFCILGDSTEPCFESSEITSYNFNKDEFKKEFTQMLIELKQFNLNQSSSTEVDNINFTKKEGNELDEKLELIAKYNLTVEQLDFSIEEISLEELEKKLQEFSNEPDSDPKSIITFSATYRQKREALANALDPKIEKDADGNITYEEYMWVEDFDDQYVYVEKSIWTDSNHDCVYGRFTYTFDEESLIASISGEFEKMVLVWLTLEENQVLQDERNNAIVEYQKLKDEFEEYKNNYSTENSEVERLQQFEQTTLTEQRKQAEESLFSQFDEKLAGIEEYEKLKETASEFKIKDLEKECYVILGIQSANFSAKPKDKNKNDKVKLDFSKKIEESYDERTQLFEKYLKKEN